jgi:DNA-binding SARP family transcriptional activator
MMNIKKTLIAVASILAANPIDAITSQVREQINAQNLTEKAIEHIVQGNLTKEHLQQDVNATKKQLKQTAEEKIGQQVNNTIEQIGQKAEAEIDKQLNKTVQQPGFDLVLALAGILAIAYIIRRND